MPTGVFESKAKDVTFHLRKQGFDSAYRLQRVEDDREPFQDVNPPPQLLQFVLEPAFDRREPEVEEVPQDRLEAEPLAHVSRIAHDTLRMTRRVRVFVFDGGDHALERPALAFDQRTIRGEHRLHHDEGDGC